MPLTKDHPVGAAAEQIGYPKNQSSDTVETFLGIVKGTLESGEDVMVSGFGKLWVNEKRGRRERIQRPDDRRGYKDLD